MKKVCLVEFSSILNNSVTLQKKKGGKLLPSAGMIGGLTIVSR